MTLSEDDVDDYDTAASATRTTTTTTNSLLEEWMSHDSMEFHRFTAEEAKEIRERLLTWYDANRRKLPWRGDAPPWEGSTVNFGKTKNKNDDQKKQQQQQRTIKQFFAAKPSRAADTETTTTTTTKDCCDNKQKEKEVEEPEPTFPVSAYGIWVSEIMLQQTRVEAVVPYWVRWMKTFPTVQALAKASEEEVNALWAGLGFYRRARLLHTAAKQVVDRENGQMPTTVQGLLKLPGIGRYTACAIASIAYHVTVPVMDGNVCRVLARLKAIANHVKAPALKDVGGWELIKDLVQAGDGSRAGDVNQALMELGATYCAPSGTGIDSNDPLRDFYYSTHLGRELAAKQARAFQTTTTTTYGTGCKVCAANGIEEALCGLTELLQQQQQQGTPPTQSINETPMEDFASVCGHKTFPTPPPKTTKREEVLAVAALACQNNNNNNNNTEMAWLLVRRPKNDGLLAGQWEFPSILVWTSETNEKKSSYSNNKKTKKKMTTDTNNSVPVIPASKRRKAVDQLLEEIINSSGGETRPPSHYTTTTTTLSTKRACLDEPIEHVFSHVRHTMWIEHATIEGAAAPSFPNNKKVLVDSTEDRISRWMTESEMKQVGVTAGVKKIIQAVSKAQAMSNTIPPSPSSKRRRKS